MDEEALSMQIYDLENQNEALALRIDDLECVLRNIDAFLKECDLPYRAVNELLAEIREKLERDVSSYRV